VLAVCDYHFISWDLKLARGPEKLIAAAIRHISKAVLIQPSDPRMGQIKVDELQRDDRIVGYGILQFADAFNSAGNYRMGINGSNRLLF
jgi:hypothetical protein